MRSGTRLALRYDNGPFCCLDRNARAFVMPLPPHARPRFPAVVILMKLLPQAGAGAEGGKCPGAEASPPPPFAGPTPTDRMEPRLGFKEWGGGKCASTPPSASPPVF